MTSNDKVSLSVCIVSFNHVDFIRECIESVFKNKSKNFFLDVTVIDNGSLDGSQKLIMELSNEFKFNVILHDKNEGLPFTLNQMLKNGNSEYICFLAADDFIKEDRFSIQLEFLEKNRDYYACSGSQIKVDAYSKPLSTKYQRNLIKKETIISDKNIFSTTNVIYSPTTMYRRQSLIDIGGYDENIKIEDLYIFYKAASKGLLMYLLPNVFTFYRVHHGNSHKKLKWMHENKMRILQCYEGTIYYNSLKELIFLEGFYSLSGSHKTHAVRLLPHVIKCYKSKYLYLGLLKLFFWW